MENSQKKQIIGIAIFVVVIIGLGLLLAVIFKQKKAPQPQQRQTTEKSQQETTAKLLATDPSDPSHINNLKYIQEGLEKYYNDKKTYPKKLDELVPNYARILPKYSSSKDYFYAYYPKDKPTAYHIGTLLGGRNQASPKAFAEDADLNSEKAGYVGGFNGADPVYDLKGGK
ncbi:hypothetical protein HY839_00155 [Candidatus Azambacteria bacterium]|nr:hypothetical protein [Candidatus Azambacteria bacterium]